MCDKPKYYDFFLGGVIRRLGEEVADVSKFEKASSLLDVACGTGEQALFYAKNKISVTGLDLCTERLEWAIKKAKDSQCQNAKFVSGDAATMPFADKEFDYSSICLGLHAMSPLLRDRVLKEMKRVTKKNIIIVDYVLPGENVSIPWYTRLVTWAIERFATDKDHYTNYVDFMKEEGLPPLTRRHNLTVEKERVIYSISILKLSIQD
ncbi:methyltransferase domain-containing protein [Candidatus Woesearchaeota archaeon]|nr:methyltransferase domain-containing protein [Candidatus Woesearchaeota archaeon]